MITRLSNPRRISASSVSAASGSYGVINAEATDWRDRVVSNGGSVSDATLNAVNTFCNAIVAAGIRSKFSRLNLFCGTGLAAALVPLFRASSSGATQLGNATDTNTNFVSGDYVETGSTGGLKGNASNKFLNTGLLVNAIADNRHLSCHVVVAHQGASTTWVGADNFNDSGFYISHIGPGGVASIVRQRAYGGDFNGTASSNANGSFIVGNAQASGGDANLWRNGLLIGALSTGARTRTGLAHYVFAANRKDSATDWTGATLGSYSIGDALTATEIASYNSAMRTFQTALGRN